ncbi:hypothetical protein PsYK624_028070 [Phanerochaete sordida]|uniref:Uncharacterized protein n=1 Tax=Phanerochaete sordida TaxID=48140 RepID=A0A9P3L908_9APHY|nr:hypothetical protein PsYK624_028070 [Phanerochaete sordida]
MLALVRAHHAARPPLRALAAARALPAARHLHASPSALAKKKKAAGSDDLFGEDDDSMFADMFGTGDAPVPAEAAAAAPAPARTPAGRRLRGRLDEAQRTERFAALLQFVGERTGLHPPARRAGKPEQVRDTAWTHLFGLALTKEQLEQVVELFPKWRESRREWKPKMVMAFVRRCEELRCPQLALKVFTDHPKYGVDLTDALAARQLLHALHVEHPLQDAITLSALHAVYKLPAVAQDFVACAMLTSACFKAATPEALTVANALVPALQELAAKDSPAAWAYPTDPQARNQRKDKAWLTWTLTKIEKALTKQSQPVDWLKQWREQAGHAQVAT